MDEAADKIVGKERAPLAAFVSIGIEHEMVDNQLTAVIK
jgi:hypothetical protein